MRKVSFALAIGFVLCACGGADENQQPKVPMTPAEAPVPTAEAPKEEAKKESPAELQKKTLASYAEAQATRDAKKLSGLYTEGAILKTAGSPTETSGREAIAQSYQKLFDAFADYKATPSRIFVNGDTAAIEWAFNGTHTGDLWGIKATEKKVGAYGLDVMWFTPEGQIKEHHVYYDGGTMLSQMGLSKQKARAIPQLASSPEVIVSTGAEDAKNVETMKSFSAALDAKKEADFLANVADTLEYDDMTQPQTSKGKADAKKFFKEMTTAFPDAARTIATTLAVGDFVITESQMTGTHKGSFFGIPATKKSLNLKNAMIVQFKDGKMVHGWTYSNGADLMQQLGLMPSPSAKAADAKAPAKK